MPYDTQKVRKRLLSIREELVLLDFINKEMTKSVDTKLHNIDTPPFKDDFGRTTRPSR